MDVIYSSPTAVGAASVGLIYSSPTAVGAASVGLIYSSPTAVGAASVGLIYSSPTAVGAASVGLIYSSPTAVGAASTPCYLEGGDVTTDAENSALSREFVCFATMSYSTVRATTFLLVDI